MCGRQSTAELTITPHGHTTTQLHNHTSAWRHSTRALSRLQCLCRASETLAVRGALHLLSLKLWRMRVRQRKFAWCVLESCSPLRWRLYMNNVTVDDQEGVHPIQDQNNEDEMHTRTCTHTHTHTRTHTHPHMRHSLFGRSCMECLFRSRLQTFETTTVTQRSRSG